MQMLLRIPLYRRQQRRPLLLNPCLPLRRKQRRHLLLNLHLPLRRRQRRHLLLNPHLPHLPHLQPRRRLLHRIDLSLRKSMKRLKALQYLPHLLYLHGKALLCRKRLPPLHRKLQLLPHRIMQLRLRRNKPWHRIKIWKLPARTSTSLQGNCAVPAKELMIYRETG